MLSKHWPTPILLVTLLMGFGGCAFPGRKSAQNQSNERSLWNPFGSPKANYTPDQQTAEEELSAQDPKDPLALKLTYARWMEESGNLPEAQRHYSEVLKAQPKNIDAILGVARHEFSRGRIDQAEQGFRRALKIDDSSANALSGLGQCNASQKKWAEAADSLTKASQGLPEDKAIRHQLAIALVHTGDLAAAHLHFTQSVGAAAAHYNIALILKDDGRLQAAEAQLELALRKDPKMKDAELWLTEIRKSQNATDQAKLQGPSIIEPRVTQTAYRDLGPMGTVEIERAVGVASPRKSGVQIRGGHSARSSEDR